ncbi:MULTISPECIES: hypothetical protein [Streptomyces]|uniref:Translation initiation factor IF-2 n=1 Tax=Streptomyces doudnae TaxID=3075536 RepID=A0ABD5EMA9_9ACTN|nr:MULTISPECIES: hypothetical protein [unclassified Streptomyces]MDT0435796.1 hypothetical protein [Streptomyces sp. DSM 41981]MYQ62683.1 hypothetical protein [Streptomyces sp. SID4950]SCD42334.1 hypothetical protein GA0115242_104916 [Streptomyces sp. SolWspMP-5a-2]
MTVQLDAVDLRRDLRQRQAAGAPSGAQDGADRPVFVDESGRRSRRFRRLGMAVGLVCAVYAVVIVVTLMSGSSDAPWLPVPGQRDDKPAGQVDTSPAPSVSSAPSATADVPPGTAPPATRGAIPSVAGYETAGRGTAGPAVPGATGEPEPAVTTTTATPGGGANAPVSSPSAEAPATVTPAPSATPSTDPSESADTGGPVANGPGRPSPVAEGTGHGVRSLAAPSEHPEYTL